MNIKSIITAVLALLVSTACSGNKQQTKLETSNETAVMAKDSKALVVFFSHAGDNYSVGNIEVGNTKIVADYITEVTGAEQFEIVTHKYDGMAYNPLIELAKKRHRPRGLRCGVHRRSRVVGHLSAGDVHVLQEACERPEGQDCYPLHYSRGQRTGQLRGRCKGSLP